MNIASELLVFIISWIKLLIKLAKFPTIQKRDRPFTSTSFASMFFLNENRGATPPGNRKYKIKKRKQSYKEEGLTSGPTSGEATRRD
jgi:hypothetical protein